MPPGLVPVIQRQEPADVERQLEKEERQLRHTTIQIAVHALHEDASDVERVIEWAIRVIAYVKGEEKTGASVHDGPGEFVEQFGSDH